jgi:hypothetical protein
VPLAGPVLAGRALKNGRDLLEMPSLGDLTVKLPFDQIQLRFLTALAEALFDDFEDMAIPVEQVIDNVQQYFALVGGTKAEEISFSLRIA